MWELESCAESRFETLTMLTILLNNKPLHKIKRKKSTPKINEIAKLLKGWVGLLLSKYVLVLHNKKWVQTNNVYKKS